jgi:hypothetical protein
MKEKGKKKESFNKKSKTIEPECHFHKLTFDELKAKFQTSLENGLDPIVAQQLLLKHGLNQIQTKETNIFAKLIKYLFTGYK